VRPLNLPYLALNLLYWVALVVPPILLGLTWLGWFHSPRLHAPKWRIILLFSGQCAGTANFVLWWPWVVWLRFHYNFRIRVTGRL
jgi:hypothetical protein